MISLLNFVLFICVQIEVLNKLFYFISLFELIISFLCMCMFEAMFISSDGHLIMRIMCIYVSIFLELLINFVNEDINIIVSCVYNFYGP